METQATVEGLGRQLNRAARQSYPDIKELAKDTGIARTSLYKVFSGELRNIAAYVRLAGFLGLTLTVEKA